MSISNITSTTPLFNNFNNIYNYRRLPLFDGDGDDSTAQVTQVFVDAVPAVYSDTANWLAPVTTSVPDDLPGKLSEMTTVNIDNFFNTAGTENIIGVISGNIIWGTEFDVGANLRLTITVPGLSALSAQLIIPSNTPHYFLYLIDNASIKTEFNMGIADAVTVHADIVNDSNVIIATNYIVQSTTENHKYTVITSPNASPQRHIGILHATDFIVSATSRTIVFDGTVNPPMSVFDIRKTAEVQISDNRTIRGFMTLAGWTTISATFTNASVTNTYEITSFEIVDGNSAPYTLNVNHYYKVSNSLGLITCKPNYKISNTPTITTIYPNLKWSWAKNNTTKSDQSGVFDEVYYDANKPSGMATIVVDVSVNSANERDTKTGICNSWLINCLKGSKSEANVSVNVPIVNGKIHIFGIWYLQAGTKNYLHPKYNNWHNGGGSVTIKSVTF